jgi:hypothetical protein
MPSVLSDQWMLVHVCRLERVYPMFEILLLRLVVQRAMVVLVVNHLRRQDVEFISDMRILVDQILAEVVKNVRGSNIDSPDFVK